MTGMSLKGQMVIFTKSKKKEEMLPEIWRRFFKLNPEISSEILWRL